MKKEKAGAYIFIFLIVLVGSYWTIRYNARLNRIKENPKLVYGYVYDYIDVGSKYPGGSAHYSYQVGNNTYKKRDSYTEIRKGNEDKFEGKYFPVVYERNNVENCKILIIPSDFKMFDIPFPDSLQWVYQYIND